MALEDLFDTLIARSVRVARRNSVMPRLVNMDTSADLIKQGGSVNVTVLDTPRTPIPIVPGPTPPASSRPAPRNVPLALDFWEDNTFSLTDKDLTSLANSADYLPKELESSAAGIADRVDQTILANYKGVYGFAGTAGTTPFATSTIEAQQATQILATQRTPIGQGQVKSIVLNPFAYANAIGLDVLQRVDASGSNITLREAEIGRALGFNWAQDQNILTHTTTAAGAFTTSGVNNAGSMTLNVAGGTTPPAFGDVFSIAGNTQTYTVLSVAGAAWTIAPALVVAPPAGSAITFRASHVVNLAFHEQAFVFASRPVAQVLPQWTTLRTFVDEVSGLVLTLEMAREYYQTAFRLSCMWGTKLVQPLFATRIAG